MVKVFVALLSYIYDFAMCALGEKRKCEIHGTFRIHYTMISHGSIDIKMIRHETQQCTAKKVYVWPVTSADVKYYEMTPSTQLPLARAFVAK